jgi:hypothetical protein
MIYYEGEENDILYQILQNEFKRKYNWGIEYKNNNDIILQPNKEKRILFKIQKKSITVIIDGQKRTRNSFYNTVIKNIYKYYFQFLITNFIWNRPTKIYSLLILLFFQLHTSDTKYYLY